MDWELGWGREGMGMFVDGSYSLAKAREKEFYVLGVIESLTNKNQLCQPGRSGKHHISIVSITNANRNRRSICHWRSYQPRILHHSRRFQWIWNCACFPIVRIKPGRRSTRLAGHVFPTSLWRYSIRALDCRRRMGRWIGV